MIGNSAFGKAAQVEIQKFDDVTHLEFSGLEDWNVTRQKNGNRFNIIVPKLDNSALVDLKTLSDKFIKKVTVEPGPDGKDSVTFILKRSDIEAFDYVTDQPSRMILDFFKAEPQKAVSAKSNSIEKSNKKLAKKLPSKRKPASDQPLVVKPNPKHLQAIAAKKSSGVFDGADPEYSRFDIKDYEINPAAVIASRRNLYIKFPMLTIRSNHLKELLETAPVYEITPENSNENKKARLLLTLFNKKRFVVFLKTLDLFREEFPKSKYEEMLGFMEADAFYGLWQTEGKLSDFETAMTQYKHMALSYTASPLNERTLLLIGYSLEDRGDYLGAYTEFQRFVRERPNSLHHQQVKMSVVDSLIMLGKYDDSIKSLQDIENDPSMGKYTIEAAYKKGNVYFVTGNYAKAIEAYEDAWKKYPESKTEFPNALYNTAEAHFWKGQYKKSLDTFREFIKNFPSNEHGGYAMTRIGELLEILGAPKGRIVGAFLESMFRFNGTQGAGIANIRLLGYRIPEKTQKEIDDQIQDIEKFIKGSTLSRLNDFKTIMIADGYFNKKEYKKSYDMLVNFYKQNPTSNNLDIFSKRIVRNLTEEIRSEVNKKNYLEAIRIYGMHSATWLKQSDRLDLSYYIAESFENTGVFGEAAKRYLQVLNKLYSIKGTEEVVEKGVFENLPTEAEVNLRLASVNFQQGEVGKSKDYLATIDDQGLRSSKSRIEKVYLASQVYEKMGQLDVAMKFLKDLAETWESNPEEVSKVYLRLGKLQFQAKQYTESEKSFDRVFKLASDSKSVPDSVVYEALEQNAELLLQNGRKKEAVEFYKSLLSRFEDKFPAPATRYKLGKIYYELGNFTEAEKTWSSLGKNPSAQFWNRLAQEQLSQGKWENDYKKYINRIPAMASDKISNEGEKK